MKISLRWGAAVAALILFVSLATAAGPRSRSVRIAEPTLVGGTVVQPGTYTVRFAQEEGSESIAITFAQSGDVVARATGRWTMRESESPYDAIVRRPSNGVQQLAEILFEDTRRTIAVDETTLAAAR
jgi:hypothetical protein